MSTIYDLIEPDDNENYIRIKQATKQGYILMEDGGQQTCLIHHQN